MDLPQDDALRWIVGTYAGLRARHARAIGDPVLVQPTGVFFPDEFQPDARGVGHFLKRMVHYAPISDALDIELAFVQSDEGSAGGCGSAACGPGALATSRKIDVEELDLGYRVWVAVADVAKPEVLAASLARAIGALVLHEAGETVDPHRSEVAAAACGFGVLIANGAAVWAKGCGGLRMSRATTLTVEEVGVLLALFVSVHARKISEARAGLGPTQRAAFDAALDWVDSNRALIEALREQPTLLQAGLFQIDPVRGPLSRWLQGLKWERGLRSGPAVKPAPLTEERRRHLEEARALVDEVMGR